MPRKYTRRSSAAPPDPATLLGLPRNLKASAAYERVNLNVKSTLLAEHYPAIATYNRRVEADGLLSDALWDE